MANRKLYTTPPEAPVQQSRSDVEPAAWVEPEFWSYLERYNCGTAYRLPDGERQPLYTTPPAQPVPVQEQTDEQEREAFEQHWYDFYHCGSVSARSDGTYVHPAVQKAWEAWQARAERCKP